MTPRSLVNHEGSRGRVPSPSLLFILAAVASAPGLAAEAAPPAAVVTGEGCELQNQPGRSVTKVLDAATLKLDDGSELRLLGLMPPANPDATAPPNSWQPEREAVAALTALVGGRNITPATAVRRTDRYGRILAHAFVERDGRQLWVEGEILAEGHARAYAVPGDSACLGELLTWENEARRRRLGLWSSPAYAVLSPYEFRRLSRLRGTYQLVEGRVAKVEPGRSQVVLHLTSRTRLAFRVRIPVAGDHKELSQRLLALLHKRVRVRGWLEWRHGPSMTVAEPALIEQVGPRR